MPRHSNQVEVCNPLTVLIFLSYSVADLLKYMVQLFGCMSQFKTSFICWTESFTFSFRILGLTEEFMVDSVTAWHLGAVAAEKAQKHQASNNVLDCLYEVFILI